MSQAAISPDGKWYALPAEDGTIKLWNLETGVLSRTISGSKELWLCQFSADGTRLLGANELGTIKVWDVATGRETTSIKLNGMFIARVRFSPDAKLLAVMGHNRFGSSEARIVVLQSGHEVMLKGHRIAVLDMAFSPDGKRVATASTDNTVGIWDLESGQEILMLKGHTDAVLSVPFSSDGRRLITASADRTIHIWDATPLPDWHLEGDRHWRAFIANGAMARSHKNSMQHFGQKPENGCYAASNPDSMQGLGQNSSRIMCGRSACIESCGFDAARRRNRRKCPTTASNLLENPRRYQSWRTPSLFSPQCGKGTRLKISGRGPPLMGDV